MEFIFKILDFRITTPTNYGWFHILFIFLIAAVTALFLIKFRNCNDKVFRRIILICWIVMIVLEIYKQFIYTFNYVDGTIEIDYQWYIFPFQFCSTPLYVLPFIAFMKEGKVRNYFTAFVATFVLFGGVVVYIYPNDVFTTRLGIDIQTMTHHGLQVVLGIFILVREIKKIGLKFLLKSVTIFTVLSAIACILNEIGYYALTANGMDDSFNMFYISPHFATHLPILSTIYQNVPYPVFLLIYLLGFALIAAIITYFTIAVQLLIQYMATKIKKTAKNS